jgi:hypothetical protein
MKLSLYIEATCFHCKLRELKSGFDTEVCFGLHVV